MAKKAKKPVHHVQMTEGKRQIIRKRQNIVCPNRQKKKQPEGCVTA